MSCDQWEPLLRDIPDDPFSDTGERCPDCLGRWEDIICVSCGLTQEDIEARLTNR